MNSNLTAVVASIKVKVQLIESSYIELLFVASYKTMMLKGSGILERAHVTSTLQTLSDFPLKDKVILLSGGVWDETGENLECEHIHISILPIDSRGRLFLRIKLFEEDFEYGSRGFGCGGQLDFHLSYSGLSDFCGQMKQIIDGPLQHFEFTNFADW